MNYDSLIILHRHSLILHFVGFGTTNLDEILTLLVLNKTNPYL